MNVTAIIHTRNADLYLQEVIDRLHDFDEILVVDMDSTDRTLEIAERNGCRIIHAEPVGYVEPARDPAMREAANDWVLFVDADELVTPELVNYIRAFLDNPGKVKAVEIPRKNLWLNGWSRSNYPDYQVRLLDRRSCTWPTEIHSNPKVKGKSIKIPKKRTDLALIHKSPAVSGVLERMNRYTDFEVTRRRNGKRPGMLAMRVKPWFRFFKMYWLKGGWRSGASGYLEAKNQQFYKLYTLAKLYEDSLNEGKEGKRERGKEGKRERGKEGKR